MEVNLTAENFDKEVINSEMPVLVDFWAPWCGPCKAMEASVAELAQEYSGRLKVCKLNVDEASEIATRYTVMSIPAFMLFKEGKIVEKRVGAMNKESLKKIAQPYI